MCNPSFVASEKLLQLLRLFQHFIQISATWDIISLLHCWPRRHSLVPNLQGWKLCKINLREFFSNISRVYQSRNKPEKTIDYYPLAEFTQHQRAMSAMVHLSPTR